ncbi:MAG: imidazole glycerol phosphate synthase subunit HisH [Bifidobacteriaceae bacterium]|nr:imidazole glycerol phosphate synthase subunit HisH [Bifidobacteriaceae bacterium]
MSAPKVVVLDYGSGNVRSAVRALERVGARVDLTADPAAVMAADGLVVPGVGAFQAVMAALTAIEAPQLIAQRLAKQRAVFGICVGMQVLFTAGLEHGQTTTGLGYWPGVVQRLEAPVVPHMGWSSCQPPTDSILFKGLVDQQFYFVHSYGVQHLEGPVTAPAATRLKPSQVTWAQHGSRFVAAVEADALCATQFHPEKSGDAGASLLANWLTML